MYTINTGSIAEVQFRGILHGQQTINVFHWEYTDAPPLTDGYQVLQELVQDLLTDNVWADYLDLLSNEWSSGRIRAQWVYPFRFAYYENTPALNAGTIVEASAPSGASVVIRRRGEPAGQAYRGRTYTPAIPLSWILESEIIPTHKVDYETFAANMYTSPRISAGTTFTPVVWTLRVPTRKTLITTFQVDDIVRYQRRRELRIGE